MIEESGLQKMAKSDLNFETFESVLSLNSHGRDVGSTTSQGTEKSKEDEPPGEFPDVALLDTKLKEVEREIQRLNRSHETRKLGRLRERREDILRIKRVEQIYVSYLPYVS